MSKEPSNPNPTFPTPAISARKSTPKSLDLENIDLSKDGKQGDVVVSKGEIEYTVTLPNDDPANRWDRSLPLQRSTQDTMLYAWKLTAPGRPDHEQVSTLDEIEAFLEKSGLPGSLPSKPIIERTRLMQHEGQGYYKSPTGLDEQWTLLWVMLSSGDP